ncbi:MAG: DUF1653 domain-containing protein [Candidatus Pacebacteria bacterium]|nr:DUF1653 domain-containing protein [Candidatus Paceibacterota bacterium]
MNTTIKIGATYQHFKNKKLYKVIALAKHSETLEDMVVYECQYENQTSKTWVRPASMWLEEVEYEGLKQPRYKLIK